MKTDEYELKENYSSSNGKKSIEKELFVNDKSGGPQFKLKVSLIKLPNDPYSKGSLNFVEELLVVIEDRPWIYEIEIIQKFILRK